MWLFISSLLESENDKEALELLEKAWAYGRGLSVDPWVPLEICRELEEDKTAHRWHKRLGLKGETQSQKELLAWVEQSQKIRVKKDLTRDGWSRLIQKIVMAPEKTFLWEELKVFLEKFDNKKRTVDALQFRGIPQPLIEFHLEEKNAKSRSQKPQ